MSVSSLRRTHFIKGFGVIALLATGGLFARDAHAQAPLAGSSIGNKASATYRDSADIERTTQSNTVSTIVQQVAELDLTDPRNLRGTPAAPVYFPHTVENTGNGDDRYNLTASNATSGDDFDLSNLLIYPDVNGDGVPDSQTPITQTPLLKPGEKFSFVVGGLVPSSQPGGDVADINVEAESQFTSGITDFNNDSVTVTTNAVLRVVKSISKDEGLPGSGPYTYTLTYTNNSTSASGQFTITDTLPAGMSYIGGTGVWNYNGNTSVDDLNDGFDTVVIGGSRMDYSQTAGTVTIVIDTVPGQRQGQISFNVNVGATTAPGVQTNVANYTYDADPGPGTDNVPTTSSNEANFTVLAVPAVDYADNLSNGDTAGNEINTGAPTDDGSVVASANQGATVTFTNRLVNRGTGDDTFNLSVLANTFPAGTSFQFFKPDGQSPLLDTNNDGTPDTGELAPGEAYNVVVKAILAPGASGGGPYNLDTRATSVSSASVFDTARSTLTTITPATLDLTNRAGDPDLVNAGVNGTGATGTTVILDRDAAPGTSTLIELNVTNTSNITDSYGLGAVLSGDNPGDYQFVFRERNSDGTAGNIITSLPNVNAGATVRFFIEVTIPEDAGAGDEVDIDVTARSATTGAQDSIRDQITVDTERGIRVTPDQSGQVFPGSSVTYPHTSTNTGNRTEDDIQVSLAGDANGFTSVAYLDANNDGVLDASEEASPITEIDGLDPNESVRVFVKVFGPLDSSQVGQVNADLNTAGFQSGGASDTATDTTTLVVGDVKLEKFQRVNNTGSFVKTQLQANPGDYVTYQITVTNTGAAPVTEVTVYDFTPGFTTYTTAAPYAAASSSQGSTTAPSDGDTGSFTFNVGTLQPGQSATITFTVRIDGGLPIGV